MGEGRDAACAAVLELDGRTDVPVYQGAQFPLINSKEETERWEAHLRQVRVQGRVDGSSREPVTIVYESRITIPTLCRPMPEGEPKIKAQPGTAAEFIVEMVHKYPGEVVLWAGGPLTNFALALKLDPEVATLAKEFVLMGGGLYADKGAIDTGAIDARREFNWWFDPEAARIVLRAPWKKMTITPIDISVKTRLYDRDEGADREGRTRRSRNISTSILCRGYMWDEIAGIALIDPSIITGQKKLYMDIDIDHGASYGKTLVLGCFGDGASV